MEESKGKELWEPIIRKILFWRDYTGSGEQYRREHDLDCRLAGGNLNADTLISLWLPLRYTLNYFRCPEWETWLEVEDKKLKPERRLKDCPAFLNELVARIDVFLPDTEITVLLSRLFDLGQERCNVIILPDRSWNRRRGRKPYFDYFPHFLYDLMGERGESLQEIVSWIRDEHLEMFFHGGLIQRQNLKDLVGTGDVCQHSPGRINLLFMLKNYISILEARKIPSLLSGNEV